MSLWLYGALAHAKMEFPRTLHNAQEREDYARWIRAQIPETGASRNYPIKVEEIINLEQALLAELLADPDYVRAAEARPPLQVIEVSEVAIEEVAGLGSNAAFAELLLKFSDIQNLSAPQAEDELQKSFSRWPKFSAQGFFSGWATVLRGEGRETLKGPNLALRWQALRRILETKPKKLLHQFKAAQFGIDKPDWNLTDMDEVVERIAQFESRIIVLLNTLHSEREFLQRFDVDAAANPVGKLLESLKSRVESLYSDPKATVEKERIVRSLILREVPPTLGIYRGVVGNDCSSANSMPFPYSPYERVWWIEDSKGVRFGYVSGNITLVDDKPTLYIRDVQVPGIGEPWVIDLVIKGLYLSRRYFGSDQMTLMCRVFSRNNNSVAHIIQLDLLSAKSVNVRQTFQDQKWRDH